MSPTRLKAVAAVLFVSLTLAGLATLVAARGRSSRAAGPILVTIVGTRGDFHPGFLANDATLNIVPELRRARGVAATNVLGRRGIELRIQLDPGRLRAHNLSIDDVADSFSVTTMIDPDGQNVPRTVKTGESLLIHVGWRNGNVDQYEAIVLRANPEGDIVRLKDVARVEMVETAADRSIEVDGQPSAAILLDPTPGTDAAELIATVTVLLRTQEDSAPPGVDFAVIPLHDGTVIGADLRLPPGSPLGATVDHCRELAARARRVDGVASVITLAGYDLRTNRHDPEVGTCLIRFGPTGSLNLATIRDRCPVAGADIGFFEPPGARDFGSAAGFSLRVLDQSRVAIPEGFLRDLSAPGNRGDLLASLAASFPDHELILNADVARRHGISFPKALAARFRPVDDGPAGGSPRRLAEDSAQGMYQTDRGEAVPYQWFLQLRAKPDRGSIHRP